MAYQGSEDNTLPPEIETLSKQLSKDPKSKAFIPLAEAYTKAGMPQEAAAVLEDGVKVYPTFVTALVALGRVYVQLEQASKARDILGEAIKISPDNLLAHRILAKIYWKDRNVQEAKRSCEKVLFEHAQDKEMVALKAELEGYADTSQASSTQDAQSSTLPVDGSPEESVLQPEFQPTEASHMFSGQSESDFGDHAALDGQEREFLASPEPTAAGMSSDKVVQLRELLERVRERRAS